MLSDYSSLESRIKDAPEPTILPRGSEVKARIISVNTGISEKNDARWYSVGYDVPDEPMALPFNDFFWEILDEDKIDPGQFMKNLDRFRNFVSAFDIDLSRPFDWEDDLPGKEGWMILGIAKDKTGEYDDKNSVKKYIFKR